MGRAPPCLQNLIGAPRACAPAILSLSQGENSLSLRERTLSLSQGELAGAQARETLSQGPLTRRGQSFIGSAGLRAFWDGVGGHALCACAGHARPYGVGPSCVSVISAMECVSFGGDGSALASDRGTSSTYIIYTKSRVALPTSPPRSKSALEQNPKS